MSDPMTEIQDLKERIKELRDTTVTQAEFVVVKSITFGMCGVILLAVAAAILNLVIK